ncbi:MAG: DUF1957 domain-containing protein [Firmicutes bacterium]|nr:DUF1957 domain-containing protein [Bacillota bacterium]
MAKPAYLSFVLHAHLPYVKHPEDRQALEHRWLFEAITECYIPLLQEFLALQAEGVEFCVTISVSPTLASMLADEWLRELYEQHLEALVALARQETERLADEPELGDVAHFYHDRFTNILSFYREYKRDLLSVFKTLADAGCLELITCGATHAFLPLVHTPEAMRAQVAEAVASHTRWTNKAPRGFWLPECGYIPGIDQILREYGISYFFVGQTAFDTASPPPLWGAHSPVVTDQGVAAFTSDVAASRQVWSSVNGYPGDPDYREYYRDIGHDLDLEIIGPYIHPDGIRVNTGLKYYRITGENVEKTVYRRDWAQGKVALHAEHFVSQRRSELLAAQEHMGRSPIAVAAFDAELFGHWWFEGPQWLGQVLRLTGHDSDLHAISPGAYLDLYSDYQITALPMSSWGRDGYAGVWCNETNDWIYPALHTAEARMTELASAVSATPETARAIRQAARELMLAQASDFAFIMDGKTTVDYAVRRTKRHIHQFTMLYEMVRKNAIDVSWLTRVEQADALLPDLNPVVYVKVGQQRQPALARGGLRILMLSWEYPPLMVGGLSRHVYDLSRFLAQAGCEVHVMTTFGGVGLHEEVAEGVHIHRVDVMKPDGGEFIHWTLAMNLAMLDALEALVKEEGAGFDVVHAHDWLVGYAARECKARYQWPLVATIHATEHGRNGGIYTDLQRQISAIEWQLTYDAKEVIVCSSYMERELVSTFALPEQKQHVIPNGVDPALFEASREISTGRAGAEADEAIIVFVGRLVREKGVQTLIEAAPTILAACPNARIVIIGKGPMTADLTRLARDIGVLQHVHFTGFVTDEERNDWLMRASVAVFPSLYEPFGIVALEAMAVNIPVVVSDVGGLADVVTHGHNGLKAIVGHAASLAEQIIALLRDPVQAKRYASVASEELVRYDWARIAEQTMAVYERALSDQEVSLAD